MTVLVYTIYLSILSVTFHNTPFIYPYVLLRPTQNQKQKTKKNTKYFEQRKFLFIYEPVGG